MDWQEKIGSELLKRLVKGNLKLLKGRVETHGTSHKIEYMISDQGLAERLVFLPGFADSKENFYKTAFHLVKNYDLMVLDMPGFGQSFKIESESYTLRNYAKWVQACLEHVGWKDFHLAGNSLGGAVAAELALNHSLPIKSLTLVDCAGVILENQPSVYHEFCNGRNLFEVTTPLKFKYFLNRVYQRPPLLPPLIWDHIYQVYASRADWHKKVMTDLLEGVESMDDPRVANFTLNRRLKDIKVPTMIVWGDEDSLFPPETAQFIQSQIPGSVCYLLADTGHSPQVESPRQFARLWSKFLKRHG